MNIDVKEAVRRAVGEIKSLYPESDLTRVMLEEVELSHDEMYWIVTIGFDRPKPSETVFGMLGQTPTERVYKVVKLSTSTGEMVSMKMRGE